MTRAELMEKLQEIFRELFGDESICLSETTTANDIEDWDSIMQLELVSTVEERFGITFSLTEINAFSDVGKLCDALSRHL